MDTDPDPPQVASEPPASKSREEKIKLVANTLNNAAGSCFTVGVVGPVVAVLINLGGAREKVELAFLVLNVGFWLSAAGLLHMLAKRGLEDLDR